MAEEKSGLEIDDWLDDLAEDSSSAPGQEAAGELDQSDIDSLLGGTAAAKGAPPESENSGELDQSDIDALLGGGLAAPVSASATGGGGEGFAELDQSDIDSLLGGGEGPAVAAPSGAGDDFELDQADLDDLFADEEKQTDEPAMAEGLSAPSKDDLDHLFSEIGDEESTRPETVGFAEVASGGSGKAGAAASGEDNFGLPDDGGFDDDEFDFGDLPDIPDETNTVAAAPAGGLAEEDIFSLTSSAAGPDFLAEATMGGRREKLSASGTDDPPFAPPAKDGKKKSLAIAALCLVLLMGGGGYWALTKNKKGEMPVPMPPPAQEKPLASGEGAPPVVAAAPVAPPNVPPVAGESRWRMSKPNETLAIELTGSDENNDPLKFEIVTPPKFGRLSGDPPKISYLPNKDFPGEDDFEFRVSDGQLASAPAKVGVMGPEEAKPVAEAAKECPPPAEPVVVAAKNMHLATLSTVPLTINWKKIWAAANPEPFTDKVSVEILGGAPLSGVLHRLDRSRHRYEPDRYFGGKEEVRYRFKAAGVYSKAVKLFITVKGNDKPPALLLRPVADSYKVGESVVLDAGLTRDDSPGGVRYSWEQLAGPPVLLEKRHQEGSAVSFVVPSSFGGEQKTRLVIRVTATDPGGQQASKEVAITPVSKRQSALWGIPE